MVRSPSPHSSFVGLRSQSRRYLRKSRPLMRVLIDTNILLRSAQPNHPLYPQATSAVAKLMRDRHEVFVCAQNVVEFWNVATRPAELNGLGFSQEEALLEVSSIEGFFTLLPDVPSIYAT